MARALIEIAITNPGGTAPIEGIKSQIEALGVSVLSVKEAGDQQDKTLQKLLDSLEPARVSTDKLTASQALLQQAYVNGKLSADRFAADLDALAAKYDANQASVTGLGSAVDGMVSQLQGLATGAGALAALGGIAGALEQMGAAAAAAQVDDAKLTATWTANAGAADISRERLDDLAQSLSDVSGFSLASEKQAEALGMTFHDVTGPTFERMMQDANDMAAALGTDVPSAVEKLGRALENPTAGLNALTRSGVAFTQEQKDQIKAMADSGNQMGAMNAILEQVESRYKGVAVAVGDTTSGSWDKLKNSLTALGVAIGSLLLPAAMGGMQSVATTVQDGTSAFNTWKSAVGTFFETLGQGAGVMAAFALSMQTLEGGTDEQLRVAAVGAKSFNDQLKEMEAHSAALAQSGLDVFWKNEADAIPNAAKGYAALQAQFDPLAKATAAYKSEIAALDAATSMHINLGGDYLTVLAGITAAYQAAKDQASGLTAAVDASNKIIAAMDPLRQKTADYNAAVDSLVTAVNAGKISQTDFAAALDYTTTAYNNLLIGTAAADQGVQSITDQLDPAAAAWRKYYEQLDAISTWEQAHEGEDATSDIVASMIAQVTTNLQAAINPANQYQTQMEAIAATLNQDSAALDTFNRGMALVAEYEATPEGATSAGAALTAQVKQALQQNLDAATDGKQAGETFLEQFGKSLATGIEGVLTSGDFSKIWKSMWSSLSKEAGDALNQALFGGKGPLGQDTAGILGGGGPNATPLTPTQDLAVGGQLVGSYMYGQAQQSGNQGEGAVGGALTGAASGYEMSGTPIGAIVGAVVGGIMGYFGSQGPSSLQYNFQVGQSAGQGSGIQAGVNVSHGGPDNATMANMTAQLIQQTQSTEDSLNLLLVQMKAAPMVNPNLNVDVQGSASDISSAFNTLLTSTLPQSIFSAFKSTLTTGIEGVFDTLGVSVTQSSARIQQEIENVQNAADFSTALAQLEAYVTALLNFGTIITELQKPLSQLVSDASEGAIQKWGDTVTQTQTQITAILTGFSSLSSTDQVSQANQAITLINQQISANEQLMTSLVSLSSSLTTSVQNIYNSISATQASNAGGNALQDFYTTQFNNALAAVSSSTSTEDLQTNMQAAEQWGQSLLGIANQMQEMIPQFQTLEGTFADLTETMTSGLVTTMSQFGQDAMVTLAQNTASTVTQINLLKSSLSTMTASDQIAALNQIASMTQTQYSSDIQELQTILGLEQSIGQSITSEMQNWQLEDTEKDASGTATPGTEANYIVTQLSQDLAQLQKGGLTPDQVSALTSQMESLADTLYGLKGSVTLTQGGQPIDMTTWLDQLMQAANTASQADLVGQQKAVQSDISKLTQAIAGMPSTITTYQGALQTTINNLDQLVQTGLGGALTSATTLIGTWETAIENSDQVLLNEVNTFVAALATLSQSLQTFNDNQPNAGGGTQGNPIRRTLLPVGGDALNPTGQVGPGGDGGYGTLISTGIVGVTTGFSTLATQTDILRKAHQSAASAVDDFSDSVNVAGQNLVNAAAAFANMVNAGIRAGGWS